VSATPANRPGVNEERIAAALRKLPMKPGTDPIKREQAIDSLASKLTGLRTRIRRASRTRRHVKASAATAKKELTAVSDAALKLSLALNALSRTASDALDKILPPEELHALEDALGLIRGCDETDLSDATEHGARGRPKNWRANTVADRFVETYPLITGKPATVTKRPKAEGASIGGLAADVLAQIFKALCIEASAGSCLDQAIIRFNRRLLEKLPPNSPI